MVRKDDGLGEIGQAGYRKIKVIDKKIIRKVVLIIILGIIGLIILFGTFYTVDTGYRGIVKTFGAPSMDAKAEGLHLKIPLAQKVERLSVQTMKYEADAAAASKDLQVVHTQVAVNYHIEPETVPVIFRNIGKDYESKIIQPAVQESVKAVTAQFTAEELITKREIVKAQIDEKLHARLAGSNINMETTSITNFDFSQTFNNAIESKVTAEQLKLKAERDLERIKVEAQQAEAQAIGQKNAQIANAEGRKQAAILEAEGNAESIKLIDEQLRRSTTYLEFQKVQRWNGVLPQVTGGAVPFVNID
jgi:regulator of protease activity HflC (stomatin/prohibitin superfamily)